MHAASETFDFSATGWEWRKECRWNELQRLGNASRCLSQSHTTRMGNAKTSSWKRWDRSRRSL